MVEYLNRRTFERFGSIPADSEQPPADCRLQTVRRPEQLFLRFSRGPVFLERMSGMPVLAVSLDGESQRLFYLDKPVRLHPGVWHRLEFRGEAGCACRRTVDEEPETCRPPEQEEGGQLSPAVSVQRVYTLFYQQQEPGFFFRGEQHSPYELVCVDKGQLHSVASGQDRLLQPGELAFYPPEQWHMQYTGSSHGASFITLSFEMDCPFAHLLANRTLPGGDRVGRLLSRMLEEQSAHRFLQDDMLRCILQEIILLVLRGEEKALGGGRPSSPVSIARENRLVEEAQRYIDSHLDSPLSVAGVARAVSISASYLSALFRKHLGMPPSRYISHIKLSESRRLLLEEGLGIAETAQQLGYATVQHFSRCFKSEFGVPPSQYGRSASREGP